MIQTNYDTAMDKKSDQEVLASGRFLRLVKRGRWEYAERPHTTGAVAVIALTDEGELVLVEQPRVPLQCRCIELPAGLAGDMDDDPDEAFIDAARRELLEETGLSARHVEHLHTVCTSPGLTSEQIELYRATGLTREHAGGGTDHEDITTHLVPLEKIDAWLAERAEQGLGIDIKVYAAAAMAKVWSFESR